MKTKIHRACVLLALAGLVACQQATSTSSNTVSASATLNSASGSTYGIQTALAASAAHSTQLSLTVPLGSTAQDVYFVFTNESASATSSGMPTVSGNGAASAKSLATASSITSVSSSRNIAASVTNARIQAANDKIARGWKSAVASASQSAISASAAVSFNATSPTTARVGDTGTYIIPSSDQSNYGTTTIATHLRYAGSTVSGTSRKLYVWVADNVWNAAQFCAANRQYCRPTAAERRRPMKCSSVTPVRGGASLSGGGRSASNESQSGNANDTGPRAAGAPRNSSSNIVRN